MTDFRKIKANCPYHFWMEGVVNLRFQLNSNQGSVSIMSLASCDTKRDSSICLLRCSIVLLTWEILNVLVVTIVLDGLVQNSL